MRIETGVIQFDDDWPGVYIRGDDAFKYAFSIRNFVEYVSDGYKAIDPFALSVLLDLLKLLEQSNMQNENHRINQKIETKSVMVVK